jgi:dTMP kinase
MPGQFISFEGVDGVGKSTQLSRVAVRLTGLGHRVISTREPGGTPAAERIRALVLTGDQAYAPASQWLLMSAARIAHAEDLIKPAIASGHIVLCDRFIDSTAVYQGALGGIDQDQIDQLHKNTIGLWPDVTIVLDMANSAARIDQRGNRNAFDDLAMTRIMQMRTAFIERADRYPSRCHIVDADDAPDRVTDAIMAVIEPRLADGP